MKHLSAPSHVNALEQLHASVPKTNGRNVVILLQPACRTDKLIGCWDETSPFRSQTHEQQAEDPPRIRSEARYILESHKNASTCRYA